MSRGRIQQEEWQSRRGGLGREDEVNEEGGLRLHKTCSVEPRPTRLRKCEWKVNEHEKGAYR